MTTTTYASLCQVVGRQPNAVAIQFRGATVSYEALLKSVEGAATILRGSGIRQGDAVVAYAQNTPELLYLYFAASKLGAVYVPVNPNMTAAEVEYICAHSEASLLLHDSLVAATAATIASVKQRRLITDINGVDGSVESRLPACPQIRPEDDCLISYTSGSTGAPKAVVLTHGSQVRACASFREFWGLGVEDVTLVALPLGYLFGLTTASAAGLLSGGRVVVLPKYRPQDVLESMRADRVTVYHGVPTMFTMMLNYAEENGRTFDLSGVRQMVCAGAPLPDEVAERFVAVFNKRLHNYYAATECSPVLGWPDQDPGPMPAGSVGRLAPGADVRILAPDGTACPVGVEGELHVRGPATITRYLKDDAMTSSALQGGWFRTGDLGRVDERGYYYITGRIKDVIFRGGANIAPAEVEGVLSRHPAVAAVAVVGVPDAVYGEVPVAFVVARGNEVPAADDLVRHAEAALAPFKVPRQYVFEEADLPLGKTGKVDKNALRERWMRMRAAGPSATGKQ